MNIKLYRCFRNKDHQKDSDQKGDLIQCTLKVRKFYDINLFKNLISIKKKSIQRNSIWKSTSNTDKRRCMHAIKSFISLYLFVQSVMHSINGVCTNESKVIVSFFFFTIKHLTNKSDLNSIKLPKCPYRRTKFSLIF